MAVPCVQHHNEREDVDQVLWILAHEEVLQIKILERERERERADRYTCLNHLFNNSSNINNIPSHTELLLSTTSTNGVEQNKLLCVVTHENWLVSEEN